LRRIVTLVSGALSLGTALAQTQANTSTPKFEAATIRPSEGCGNNTGRVESSPGRLTVNCQTLLGLITSAYFVFANGRINPEEQPPSIEGGSSWMGSDLYTISAKGDTDLRQEMMRGPMLQALLEDRFKLKAHFETKGEIASYVLTVSKGGPTLQPWKEGSCAPVIFGVLERRPPIARGEKSCNVSVEPRGEPNLWVVDVHGVTLAQLSSLLTYPLAGPVVDKTGISGRFDIRFEFAIDGTSPQFVPDGAAGPSIVTALRQQLGLKLDRGEVPRYVLVIDSAQRPSEN
jgi:uncharacterized protein (TIGR03435 family)